MRSNFKFAAIALATLATVSAHAVRPDRNAFVDYKVSTVSELLSQVQSDPQVADRYMRHFGMTRSQLTEYFRTLHRENLRKAGTYTVYSIPPDGHVKMHIEHLKKGEPVFADASGNAVLIAKCGNPVTLGPGNVLSPNPNEVEAAPSPTGEETLKGNTPTELTGPSVGTEDMALTTPAAPTLTEIATPPTYTSLPPEAPTEGRPGVFSSGSGIGPTLGALPILGGILIGVGSHGGHGHAPAPVPEPSALVGMLIGVGALGMLRSKRSR